MTSIHHTSTPDYSSPSQHAGAPPLLVRDINNIGDYDGQTSNKTMTTNYSSPSPFISTYQALNIAAFFIALLAIGIVSSPGTATFIGIGLSIIGLFISLCLAALSIIVNATQPTRFDKVAMGAIFCCLILVLVGVVCFVVAMK